MVWRCPYPGRDMNPLGRLRRAAIDVQPLRHADFRRLWLGNSLGFVGFQLTAVAVPVQVFELTGSSFWVGMLGMVGLVPLVLFGLWGGAVAAASTWMPMCPRPPAPMTTHAVPG